MSKANFGGTSIEIYMKKISARILVEVYGEVSGKNLEKSLEDFLK